MAFQRIVHVVNRTTEELEVCDDGKVWIIKPGYKLAPRETTDENGRKVLTECYVGAGPNDTVYMEPLPYFSAERAKRQNPVMGTLDPLNANSFESLIGIPDWGDDITPREQSEAIELLDRSLLSEEAQKATIFIPVGGRKPTKMTRAEQKKAAKEGRVRNTGIVMPELVNPLGIRLGADGI